MEDIKLRPKWVGEFTSFEDWINRATTALASHEGYPFAPMVCVDAQGRRCYGGAGFMRAQKEGAFPVRYFFEMEIAA